MADWEKTIIPLDDANEMLSVFESGRYFEKEYQRWRRDDGFRHVDFEGVLCKSRSVLIFDNNSWLAETGETIVKQLSALGIDSRAEFDDEGDHGFIEVGGKRADIKYVPTNDFNDVIRAINPLIEDKAHYRKFRSCQGSDTYEYAILKNEDWKSLEGSVPELVKLLFGPIDAWDGNPKRSNRPSLPPKTFKQKILSLFQWGKGQTT
jgi:hypothetical protein